MPSVLYVADVLCPMRGPPLAHGGVLVDGWRVVEVGAATDLARRAQRVYEVEGVLLPALVNGRTQVEHADADALAVRGPFDAWSRALAGVTGTWSDDAWTRSARRGVQRLLRAGIATAGDVVTHGPGVPAAARAGLAGDSWVEIAMVDAEHADEVVSRVATALTLPAEGRRVGVGPDAPHTLGTGVLRALGALAAREGAPLTIAAARNPSEVAAIRSGEGPLAEVARERGMDFEWLPGGTGLTPVRYLDACGVLRPGTTVAHGTVVDVLEARLLAARGVTVVCCPRADDLLGGPDAPLERYAGAETPLALGTASFACAEDADLLGEAAAWVRLATRRELAFWPSSLGPVALEEQALRLATVEGARAMGWGEHSGVIEPGRRADLVGIAVNTDPTNAARDLIEQGPGRAVLTVVAGVRRARRDSADDPWPQIDRRELETH